MARSRKGRTSVWPRWRIELMLEYVADIPCGKVVSYGDLARAVGVPRGARRVGLAMRLSVPGDLPWHRVVGADGRILLRGAQGREQRRRLEQESVPFTVSGSRVRIGECRWDFPVR